MIATLVAITLYYKLDTENYTLCRLEEPDYIRASDFIDLHLSEFRPKVSWRNRTLSSMALNGLQTEKWTGYVYKNKENHLVSYLDYKIRTDGDIELGIQLTSETERKKHFATALINYLRFKYMYAKFFTGTYEENEKMRAVLKITGFHEYLFKSKDQNGKKNKKQANRIQERVNPHSQNGEGELTYSVYYSAPSVISEVFFPYKNVKP